MARVILEHLSKRYHDFVALNDLTMEIRDKEFFILLGPSGCGKSTLLRLIAGLEKPTEGRIIIGDKLVNDLLPWQRGVAMAFESPSFGLMPNMTAYDSMAFGLRFSKPGADPNRPHSAAELEGQPGNPAAAQGEIRKRVERVASRLGIGGYLGRKQDELSAGHRQTVALGRAVTRQPQVFLLDDPLSQADSGLRASSRMELRRIHAELQTTIIYVTHDQLEAMSLGTRIAVLNKGVLQQVSTPQALYERPANTFVATFIGSPPMNLFRLELVTDGTQFHLRTAGGGANPEIDLQVPGYVGQRLSDQIGRSLLIGVRPEQMHDAALLPADSPATARISADVELTEYTGQEVYYHLVAAGQRFIARLDGRTAAHIGQRITIAFDPADIHAFDLQSERSLL